MKKPIRLNARSQGLETERVGNVERENTRLWGQLDLPSDV